MPSASVSKRPQGVPLIRISVSLVPFALIDLVNVIIILIRLVSYLGRLIVTVASGKQRWSIATLAVASSCVVSPVL